MQKDITNDETFILDKIIILNIFYQHQQKYYLRTFFNFVNAQLEPFGTSDSVQEIKEFIQNIYQVYCMFNTVSSQFIATDHHAQEVRTE